MPTKPKPKPKARTKKKAETKQNTKTKTKPKTARVDDERQSFTTNDALFEWMHDEYLSEITLDAVKPLPKKSGAVPREVRFTWSLHGTGNGDIVPYLVHAKGVRAWNIDGKKGSQAIGMSDATSTGTGKKKGVHFFMETPARVELACDSVDVVRGKVKKGKLALPFTDYDHFHAEAERRISIDQLLAAFGAPADATLAATPSLPPRDALIGSAGMLDVLTISVRGAPWIKVQNFNHDRPNAFEVRVARAGGTDDEWHRAQEMPHRLGPSYVSGAWEFSGDDVKWMAAIGKPVASSRAKASAEPPKSALDRFKGFAVEGTRPVTLQEVVDVLGPPAGAVVWAPYFDAEGRSIQPGPINIKVGEWSWAQAWCSAPQRAGNAWRMSFTRQSATDEEWRRVMQLPRVLGASWVHCDSKLQGSVDMWMKAIRGA